MSSFRQMFTREIRFAARALLKSPVFTLTTVLTLAVCIGANTALFSVVDAVLLRPLPYPEPERLAEVITRFEGKGTDLDEDSQNGQTWFLIRDRAQGYDAAVASGLASGVNFAADGRVEYVQQERVGAGFFRVLGIAPLLGREFSSEEDTPGGPAVALLSHRLWQRAFQADPSVLGREVMLRGVSHQIVGVMPPELVTTGSADLWTPLQPSTTGEGEGENYRVILRLREGTTWPQANAQIAAIGQTALENRRKDDPSIGLTLVPLQRGLTENVRKPLLVLWAAAGMLLLIGCVNIASLLLARAVARSRETATRLALGAGRGTILQQLLAESLLLGTAGGLGGLLLGFWLLQGVKGMAQGSLELWQTVALDVRVLACAIAASLLSTLVVGLLPAFQVSRVDLRATLGEGGRGSTGGGHQWTRRVLVIAEVALSVVLLVCAGLFLRTFSAIRALQPGFEMQNVLTAQLSLQDARYTTGRQVNRLFTDSLSRIRELPGVEGAAVGLGLPYERHLRMGFQFMDGPEAAGPDGNTTASYITPDYFTVLRIPLLRGRPIRESDGPDAVKVAVVNQTFASRYFPQGGPLGRHIQVAGETREIVGVVGDILQQSSGDKGPIAPLSEVFFPAAQASDEMIGLVHMWFSPSWIIRTAEPPQRAAAGIQSVIEAVDPHLPIASFRGMDQVRQQATARQRFQAILLAMLAGPAVFLAALGIYGLIAHSVAERRREMGIRLALGSTRWQAMRAVAQPGLLLAVVGVVVGCLLARVAVQSLQHLIWGVRATDPSTFAGVAIGLLLVAAAASLLPTLGLSRLDPSQTLRDS